MTENANRYYIPDDRSDKERFFSFWAPSCGQEATERAWEAKQSKVRPKATMVMGDIQPYKSMIDGQMIESRSKHRSHLKQHNCIEIGNETKHLKNKPVTEPDGLKEEIIRQTYARK